MMLDLHVAEKVICVKNSNPTLIRPENSFIKIGFAALN
jgi:hypothetical protein